MRKVLAATLLAVLATGASADVPGFRHEMSDQDKQTLNEVSDYLNSIHTLKATFVQIGPEGQIDEGTFWIDKPGKMRFEYTPPNPTLVVSDGSQVAVVNKKLATIDRYPLLSTPLSLILSDHVNLARNSAIAGIDRQPGELIIEARSHSDKVNGNISLVFAQPTLELRQWTVVDAQGLSTTVSVRDARTDLALDPSLFTIPQTVQADKTSGPAPAQ